MAAQFKAKALLWAHHGGCLLLLLHGLNSLWNTGVMAAKDGGRAVSLMADSWQLLIAGEAIVAGVWGLCGLPARWIWGATAALWLTDVVTRVTS